jgi:hypothetical protein
MQRPTSLTNQRIGFSIEPCGRHLATGGTDGCVRVSADSCLCSPSVHPGMCREWTDAMDRWDGYAS